MYSSILRFVKANRPAARFANRVERTTPSIVQPAAAQVNAETEAENRTHQGRSDSPADPMAEDCPISDEGGVTSIYAASSGSNQGAPMADKSPRQHLSKQADKSLKEKRAEKHAKTDAKKNTEGLPPGKKH
jgi:hypothetical protein